MYVLGISGSENQMVDSLMISLSKMLYRKHIKATADPTSVLNQVHGLVVAMGTMKKAKIGFSCAYYTLLTRYDGKYV